MDAINLAIPGFGFSNPSIRNMSSGAGIYEASSIFISPSFLVVRWDNKTKEKISRRHEVYKKVVSGRKELWDVYCILCKEVKEAVREKNLSIWNEVVEKFNAEFEGSRMEFWAFVGRRTKGRYKNITSLKSKLSCSVSN